MLDDAWRGRSLTLRVLILLSLALLPLGAIAFWQTQRMAIQAELEAEITLASLTEHAIDPVEDALQRAFGAASAIGPRVVATRDDPAACSATLARLVEADNVYSFAGFVPRDGVMRCSSDGRIFDFSASPELQRALEEEAASVTLNPDPPLSGVPVVIVTEPLRDGTGSVVGFLSLSIPVTGLDLREAALIETPLAFEVIVFNDRGDVLLPAENGIAAVPPLPEGQELADLARAGQRAFTARPDGEALRVYAVADVVPGLVYAVASWPDRPLAGGRIGRLMLTGLMPALMWVASLLVAVLALERLLFRHIRALGMQMRTFARSRRMLDRPVLEGAGTELTQIEADFRDMAQSILQDEARLEDSIREKNILLKEIHHRVQNNLQLISSIMNMQARRLPDDRGRSVLRRVQDRVMSLAAVHRALYQSPELSQLDAGAVIATLARQIVSAFEARSRRSVPVEIHTDAVPILPDDLVPLALAVSEALTNALEQTAAQAEAGHITLSLTRSEPGWARLVIRNDSPSGDAPGEEGLGLQLIRAFARQLDGTLRIDHGANGYALDLSIPTRTRRDASRDY